MRGEQLYCRSVALDGLFEFVKEKGGDPFKLAADVGLDPNFQFKSIDFVSWNTACDFLELCAERLNMPTFGVEWAKSLPENSANSGPVLLVSALKKNLRETLEMAIDYQKIHTNGVTYSFKEDLNTGEVTGYIDIHPLSRPARQFCEHILAHITILSQRYVPDYQLKRISFQHSAPQDPDLEHSIFPDEKIYNAGRNTLVGDISVFETPTSHLTALLFPILRSYLDHRKKSVSSRTTITLDVAELLPNMFGLQQSQMSDVAAAMQISQKKLQRLLKEEGTSFSAVLNDVRRASATRLLLESNISITRLAHMLDYGSVESFNTACQRWHGSSPRQIRNREHRPPISI